MREVRSDDLDDQEQRSDQTLSADDADCGDPARADEVGADLDEAKVLLSIQVGADRADPTEPAPAPPDDVPRLPRHLHPFRDPRHDILLDELERKRILLLTSYQESAAYSAAFTLIHDDHFHDKRKKALFPRGARESNRLDFDVAALTEREFLGKEPQILLVEINSRCSLLESTLTVSWGVVGQMSLGLEHHGSYLILAVDEDLLCDPVRTARVKNSLPYYSVSHLRYLLSQNLADRVDEFERRLLACIERDADFTELRELEQKVAIRLAGGVSALDTLLHELEEARSLPTAARRARFQPISPEDVFLEDSAVHQTVLFIATYLPNLSQGDFDRLVLLLLGDETCTTDCTRQVVRADGELIMVRERVEERWADRWRKRADQIFRDCHLQTTISGEGTWVVDFGEPYLRRELRGYLGGRFAWYVRRQCMALQDSGVIFAFDLSRNAVDSLVRLYVERALVDPVGFGSLWLLALLRGVRFHLPGEPPAVSPEEDLAWLLDRLAVEAQLLAHFYGRLALLIREMLDREPLRVVVREFFDFLIAARQHEALLGVILDLARQLRFAPHFDSLAWMRRLLDQGSRPVRERVARQLILLARESGPRIYEFLTEVRDWLPEQGRSAERFSVSNRLALEFPFAYCHHVARLLPKEHFGAWPSRHPLFHALPVDPVAAREEIARIIEWLLDPRGASLERPDPAEAMRTAEAVRIGHFADLLEGWAWILEGKEESGSPEGRALFLVIVEEIERRLDPRQRSWLQRSWQRRQAHYLRLASKSGGASDGPERSLLIARRTKLEQLRMRFALLVSGDASDIFEPRGGTAS